MTVDSVTKGGQTVWRYRSIGVPMTALIVLSALVVFSASILLLNEPAEMKDLPVLMTMREIDGSFFAKYHFLKAPKLYGWLHAVPAVLWCAAMPTQHVKSFRRKYINVHRWIGRALITLSILLAMTGSYFSVAGLTITADFWHVHKLKFGKDPQTAITYLAWPSFRLWGTCVGPFLGVAACFTYYYARKGDIVNHQRWAEITTYIGYTVPMERIMIAINFLIGVALHYMPSDWRANLRVPTTLQTKHEAEKGAFAFTVWSASAIIFTYVAINIRRQRLAAVASSSAKAK